MQNKMKNLGYYDGQIDLIENVKIPMTDRVCWFGDGVYDATCTRNGVIYCLDDHVDRFFRSASMIDITPPFSKEELKELLNDLVTRVDTAETNGETSIYWQITRGAGMLRNHAFPKNAVPKLWITVTPKKLPDPYREVGLVSAEDVRYHLCNVKTVCLLPNVLAAEKAEKFGADECVQYRILADGKTRVTEGSHSNVHCFKDGVLYTAPLDELILPGIARKNIIAACKALGIPVKEEPFTLEFLTAADEIFVSASSNFCIRALSLDGKPIGGKDSARITALRDALVRDYFEVTSR